MFNPNSEISDAYTRILAWEAYNDGDRKTSRFERYRRNFAYFSGHQELQGEHVVPIAANYIEFICESHASFLWGQWEDSGKVISWSVRPKVGKGDSQIIQQIQEWLNDLFTDYELILYSMGLDQSIFGDAIMVPRWDPIHERVYPESILPEYFHARWSPHDILAIREVVIAYPMHRMDAMYEFGTKGNDRWKLAPNRDYAMYWEHWTTEEVSYFIDNVEVGRKPNPFQSGQIPGFIPFIHIPSRRAGGEYYGISDIDSCITIQDQLNQTLSDAGDLYAYNTHPIIQVKSFFGDVQKLPFGPDRIWDMGRDGEASYLSGSTIVNINDYLEQILFRLVEDLGRMPAAAYGRSEAAKTSALALDMEMVPVESRINLKRMYWKIALRSYAYFAARISEMHNALPFPKEYLRKVRIEPLFAPILPRDQMQRINENVSLATNGLRSTRRALQDLGEPNPEQEIKEIYHDLERKNALGMSMNLGGKNQRGPGGSPETGTQTREETEAGGKPEIEKPA